MTDGAWRCEVPIPHEKQRGDLYNDPAYCRHCGAAVDWHPVDVCCDCYHLVIFHGADTEGCGRINAAGWCDCRMNFGRDTAEYVRYW